MIFVILLSLWARYLSDAWIVAHGTLNSAVYKQLVFTNCIIFQLFLVVSVNICHNSFFIFYLDTQHPFWLEKLLTISVEVRISSSPFVKFPLSSCTPMWVWVYYHESEALFPNPPGGFNFDGWSTCGCQAIFPRHKGRKKIYLYCSFLSIWWRWLSIATYSTEYDYS
jgi:hypothetical protein